MFRRAIAQQRHCLAQMISVDTPLLNRLCDAGVITAYQRDSISSKVTSYDRADELLNILGTRPDDKFDIFCEILEDEGRKDVVVELRKNVSKSEQTTATGSRHSADDSEIYDVSLTVATNSQANLDEIDAGANLKQLCYNILKDIDNLKQTVADQNERFRSLERKAQLDELKQLGFTDKGYFVDFVVQFFLPARAEKLKRGSDVDSSVEPLISELKYLSTYAQVACRLTVDIVCYFAATKAGRLPREPFNEVAVSFRKIVTGMVRENADKFEGCVKVISMNEIRGYDTMVTISDQLFNSDDKWNWGRMVAWFAMCAYIAGGLDPDKADEEALEMFAMYVWFFVNQRYEDKIQQNGKWESFVTYVGKNDRPTSWLSTIASYLSGL